MASDDGVAPVRRVIAGIDASGRSVVLADTSSPHVHTLPGMPPSLALTDLWYVDGPVDPGAVADTADRELAVGPVTGGALFRVVQFPPDDELPRNEDGDPALFWHATDTVDFNVVLQGRLVLLVETGSVELGVGDTFVVRGGRHAFSNPGPAPAVLAATAVGVTR